MPKLYKEKHSSEYNIFAVEKKIHEKSFLKGSVKFTNRVTQECWKKTFYSRRITSYKNHVSWKFFWTTLLSERVQRTDDRKVSIIFWRKQFFSLKFVFFKKIWLVLYDSSLGVHTNQGKKKHFFGNCFLVSVSVIFFWHCYEWEYRVPKMEKEISFLQNTLCTENYSLQKKTLVTFVVKDEWGTKNDESNWSLYFEKKIMENFFDDKIFLKDTVVTGSTEEWP